MANHVSYALHDDGSVRHWLGAGPAATRIPDAALRAAVPEDGSPFGDRGRWTLNYWAFDERVQATKGRIYAALEPPVELVDPEPLPGKRVAAAGPRGGRHRRAGDGPLWRYLALEDEAADFSRFSFTPALVTGHVYAEVVAERACVRPAELLTIGPAHVWLDGGLAFTHPGPFGYVHLQRVPFELALARGVNRLWLRADMIGLREARVALGLRLRDAGGLSLRLPVGALPPHAWANAESSLAAASVTRFVVPGRVVELGLAPTAGRGGALTSGGADADAVRVAASIEVPSDPPWAQDLGTFTGVPGGVLELALPDEVMEAHAATLGESGVDVVLRPADGLPLERRFEVVPVSVPYREAPYGTYAERRHEALAHLARMPHDALGSAAAVRLGTRACIATEAVAASVRFLDERRDTADFHALGLLALEYWFGGGPALAQSDREGVREALRTFKFWLDEPGLDAMCYFTENHQILFHASEFLAAQRWPEMVFASGGRSGAQRLPVARERILAWIRRRLSGGFSEWDSNAYLAMDAFALLALVEFAHDEVVAGAARRLLDVLFFALASQSFRGTQGCTHGRCYVGALKTGRNEATSALQRIAWGMGTFNGETRAPGLLALSERYVVPDAIQAIGADLPATLVTRVRAAGAFTPESDMRGDRWDVSTLTRRTPDYQLAAALDHRPGALGVQEHLWQATLGPDAAVFTTYPGNRLEHGHARPNFWAGSARLPHVGMDERTLLCLYRLDPAVGLGYTHAYFPTASFDAWHVDGAWAFARRRDGYVALWGDGPLALTPDGRFARQELRSTGPSSAWLCTVGSAAEDGSFAAFREGVAACRPPTLAAGAVPSGPTTPAPLGSGPALRWRTPQGSELELVWQRGMRVDGEAVDTAAFPRYDNAYTRTELGADRMVLRVGRLRHEIALGVPE